MKRIVFIAARWTILTAALVYIGDYLSLRYRIPNQREQFGSVMVQRSYAIPQKDRKTEYMFDPPAPQICVNSLFPHFGDPPCWYLRRHARQQISAALRVD
ncbi:MAG TPA: hypothetical protein VKR61_19205 [Bryobacteraceae bacterium]|nr:hypothetical protein [Bryobacteraceae bacterium]